MKFILIFIFFFNINSYAHEIQSLKDMPSVFSGKAGNLIHLLDTRIEFKNIYSFKIESNSFGDIVDHNIEGFITIGQNRKLEIFKVLLQKYESSPKYYTLKIFTKDNFVKVINFELRKEDNSFNLIRHNIPGQELQMALTGKMPISL